VTRPAEPAEREVHTVCVRYHTAIELIGTRWTGAVLRAMFTGGHRFSQLKAAVPGLSDKMLADRLRLLERRGLVERTVVAEHPVRIDYRLTEMGRDLAPVLDAIVTWSHKWIPLPPAD
jgi:DNA-binding HxlR family transcriptional regulator